LRDHDLAKAEECLRESISLNSTASSTLLTYAVVLFMLSSYEEADVFFDVVLDTEPSNMVCWAMRGLVYDQTNRPDDALQAYAAARRIQEDATEAAETVETGDSSAGDGKTNFNLQLSKKMGRGYPLLEAAKFLLDIHATSLAEKALTLCQVYVGAAPEPFNLLARLYTIREDFEAAEESVIASLDLDTENVEGWTLKAHVAFIQNKEYEALNAYKKVLSINPVPLDNAVYLRYAQLLINTTNNENIVQAKEISLKACLAWPCSTSWLGVAVACYLLQENDEAESALVEANIADNQNGVVWAYTTLVCLRLKRTHEADHAFGLALRLGIDRRGVLVDLGQAYIAEGKPAQAEPALRRALAIKEDAILRRTLADVCKELGDVDGAVEEYKCLMDLVSGDEAKGSLLKEIIKLLKNAGREKEAGRWQKAYKALGS